MSRQVRCEVRPLSIIQSKAYLDRYGDYHQLPNGLIGSPALVNPLCTRRAFMRSSGAGLATLTLGTSLSGCTPEEIDTALKLIKLAKTIFDLSEEIYGHFIMNNKGSRSARFEVITNLKKDMESEQAEDSISCIAELPPNSGLMEVSWCLGLNSQSIGEHVIEGIEGGHAPIFSPFFQVAES